MNFLRLIWKIVSNFFESHTEKANHALDNDDWLGVIIHIMIVVLAAAACIIVPILILYRFRVLIKSIAVVIAIPAVLIASFYENNKKSKPMSAPPPPVEEVKVQAEETYPLMKQTAFLLFGDLCRYLPGLVAPFSLSSVVAPVKFDITASLVTVFHFVVAKGSNDASISEITEILEEVISQHLSAQDLPMSIPAIYTSADGSTWPGLVVDGVYGVGQYYRVDLVITNEAEVTRLKARSVSKLDRSETGGHSFRDEDFD